MKLMFPKLSVVSSCLTLLILSLTFIANVDAQSKKKAAPNKKGRS